MIDVAIINWNTAGAAISAADAYLASEGVEVEVTIVDNLSHPEQRRLLSSEIDDPRIRLVLADRNLGYGAAANLALREGSSPLVCVSNADVMPEAGALAELCRAAFDDDDAGMVGPVFSGPTQNYHSQLPSRTDLLIRSFVGRAGRRPPRTPAPGETVEVGQVSGACFVMRRQTWEEVGGFDEGYFLWYEDVDLAKRLNDRGKRNVVIGSATVGHVGAASFDQIGPRTAQAIRLASLRRYIGKHNPELLPAAQPLLQASEAVRARGATDIRQTARSAVHGDFAA